VIYELSDRLRGEGQSYEDKLKSLKVIAVPSLVEG
jgi:hypothetical protein